VIFWARSRLVYTNLHYINNVHNELTKVFYGKEKHKGFVGLPTCKGMQGEW